MCPTRLWIAFNHRHVACFIVKFKLETRSGILGFVLVLEGNILFLTAFPYGVDMWDTVSVIGYSQFAVFNTLTFFKIAFYPSKVYFWNFIFQHQLAENVACLLIFSKKDDSWSLPIESVDCFDGALIFCFFTGACILRRICIAHLIFEDTLQGIVFEISTCVYRHRTLFVNDQILLRFSYYSGVNIINWCFLP